MKGKDIIKIIQDKKLENIEIEFIHRGVFSMFCEQQCFSIDDLYYVERSSNKAFFWGDEK